MAGSNGTNGNGQAPGANGEIGRDPTNGRWRPGYSGGPGNPYFKQIARWRAAFHKSVLDKDVQTVIRAVVKAAKAGDMAAAKIFLERTLGKVPDVIVTDDSARQLIAVIRGVEVDV